MEDLYLVEFFVEKISLQCQSSGFRSPEDKKLTAYVDFGNVASFVINQNEFADDIIECDTDNESISSEEMRDDEMETTMNNPEENGSKLQTTEMNVDAAEDNTSTVKTFRGGASLLFSHNPEGLKQTFRLFPLEISVWTDDESEKRGCVGISKIMWDTEFLEQVGKGVLGSYHPLTWKSKEKLRSEVTGSVIGEIVCSVRFSILGKVVTTRFKAATDEEGFLFRNKQAHSSIICKKYGSNPKPLELTSYGAYEESGRVENMVRMIEQRVSPEMGGGCKIDTNTCDMPLACGNVECRLNKIIKSYMSPEETTKGKCDGKRNDYSMGSGQGNVGGGCSCNCKYLKIPQEQFERNTADQQNYVVCEICGGASYTGKTCKDEVKKDSDGKKMCSGPCNLDRTDEQAKDGTIQRMLYEGLSKMLCNVRSNSHKKFCPEFQHKSSCPKGGQCCK